MSTPTTRTIKGTYVAIDVPHLDAHLDEQSFQWSNRKGTDQERFHTILSMVAVKRLTYEELIGWWETYYPQPNITTVAKRRGRKGA
ncbi:MAG: hypothetical protein P4L33_20410 [Capsulimonadaceae bacterium]|nr:hypothetical protein [Capsulimonadaceae bacterium]